MHNLLKLISASRKLVSIGNSKILNACACSHYYTTCIQPSSRHKVEIISKDMSQRSITSFFTKTPKKSIESDDANKDKSNTTPVKNTDVKKKSSKRQRIESSSSDSQSPVKPAAKPSPQTPEKKKSKRLRIDSSGSEASGTTSDTPDAKTTSDTPEAKTMSDTPDAKLTVKQEALNGTPKTYASPKTKKSKVKSEKFPLVEKNIKVESVNGGEEKKPDEEKKPAGKTKSTPVKSPVSKKKKTIVKTEKEDLTKFNDKGKKEKRDDDGQESTIPIAEEDYNPAKAKYHPVKDACWSKGQAVPYLALAKTLEAIEATSARLKIIEILSNYLRSVMALTPDDLLPSVYMCLNQLAPAHHSLELGIAETYLMKAIGQCTGRTLAQTRAAALRTGDLGLVAEQARAQQKTMFKQQPLTARKVFDSLREIARITGQASVNKKIAKIQTLYVACRHSEARYLIRSLAGKLRIGLAEQSVLQALALACAQQHYEREGRHVSPEQLKSTVDSYALSIKSTYCACPNYELVIPALLAYGPTALPEHCRMQPGAPLKPMLAHPSRGVADLCARFDGVQFTCEWKYDGERAQIHLSEDGARAVFSRNQEDNTSKYPDVLGRLPALLGPDVKSCVLDAEAVAYDVATKQILPFQVLSTRKRKDAQESEIKVQVCVFVFDLLYLNGAALVERPLRARRQLLRDHFVEVEGQWQFARWRDCSTVDEVQQFLDEAVKGCCEGLMVKTLDGPDATYEIARRSHNWLKLKKDYLEGVGDTLDVVPLGGYRGKGKRAGTFGGFLLACYDPESEQFQSLCKIGTGFSDEDLQTLSDMLSQHVVDGPKSYYRYDSGHEPDAWFSTACVWEVRCADLSLSPAHHAAIGLVQPDKGISLRFPRFVRVRDDKSPEQATTAQQVAEMYLAQDQVKNQTANQTVNNSVQDDFY